MNPNYYQKKHLHRHDNSCKQVEKSILSVIPDLGQPVSGIPFQVAERPVTNRFFGGFYPVFISFFLSLDILYGHDTDILKRNWTWLAFIGSTGN